MTKSIHLFSGGACQGLLRKLDEEFERQTGYSVQGQFGAVGMMRDNLLRGEKCDVIILSQKLIDDLSASGHVVPDSARAIGKVQTGVATKEGDPPVSVEDADALSRVLRNATEIFFPDPQKATAGIHFMSVLKALELDGELAARLRPFPNGATAMAAMAKASNGSIGCTQISEILSTPGVSLMGPLPKDYALATTYVAAVTTSATEPSAAAQLISLLTDPRSAQVRRDAGIE